MSRTLRPLWDRLPRIHREVDLDGEGLLDALTGVFETELRALHAAPWSRYDDLFVQTASPGALALIAMRVGQGVPDPPSLLRRASVANHLRWQRRRGTRAALEGRARDVTGWFVEVEELLGELGFELDLRAADTTLGATPGPGPTLDARTSAPRTVELRSGPGTPHSGGVRDLSVRVHRTRPGAVEQAMPAEQAPGRYTFDPLGRDRPLASPDPRVPAPTYGPDQGVCVWIDGQPVPPEQVMFTDLAAWEAPPDRVAIDPLRGRLSVPDGPHDGIAVDTWVGHAGALGATPFLRPLRDPTELGVTGWVAMVCAGAREPLNPGVYTSLDDAVAAWILASRPPGLIRFADSATYSAGGIDLGAASLCIEADPGEVPCLLGDLAVRGESLGAHLEIAGVLLGGSIELSGDLALAIDHATVAGGIRCGEGLDLLEVDLADAILGPIRLPGDRVLLHAVRCLLDGGGTPAMDAPTGSAPQGSPAGPLTTLDRCTCLGDVRVLELDGAVDCLIVGDLVAAHRNGPVESCAFRHGPDDGVRCVPFGPQTGATDGPRFVSLDPAHPGYGLLRHDTDPAYRTGARSGSELGAFHDQLASHRLELLREVLREQVPTGLTAVIEFAP